MSFLQSENSSEKIPAYFPFFNHTLYMEQGEYSKEEDLEINNIESLASDELSTSISQTSNNSLEDEEKLIPLNLLDLSPVKNPSACEIKLDLDSFVVEVKNEDKKIKPELQKFILPKELFSNSKCKKTMIDESDEKKLKAKPFIPSKYKIDNTFLVNYPQDFFLTKNKYLNKFNNFSQSELCLKKIKKKFVERKGDWKCSKCQNINFAFRNKCNKCNIDKKQSEEYLKELEDKMLKIDFSSMNK